MTHYACQAIIADLDETRPNTAGRPQETARIELLAASLPLGVTPMRDDQVIIAGQWYRLQDIARDSAGVVYLAWFGYSAAATSEYSILGVFLVVLTVPLPAFAHAE